MARGSFWVRELNLNSRWPKTARTTWNESTLTSWPPGTTIVRTLGNVRFWVPQTEAAIVSPNDLYSSYSWALCWDDGRVPNMDQMQLYPNLSDLKESILHMESFSMRDAWTSPRASVVSYGYIDDRPVSGFESHARRLSDPVEPKVACTIRFFAQGVTAEGDFFPINFFPRVSLSILTLATVPG